MAQLHFQDTFTGTVSQTTDIVLAGEVTNAPLVADYTIEVSANLGNLVSYSGAYNSADIVAGRTATYPTVSIDSSILSTAAASADTTFRDKDATGNLMPSPNDTTPHLQGMFKTLGWVYPTPVFPAGSTPVEAVIDVSFGAITATTFTDAISGGTWSSSDGSSAAVNLFEQCLAAGKIEGTTLGDASSGGSASFSPGDSVSLYVSYTLTKTRSYTADGDINANSSAATITVGNVTITPTATTEVSTPISKVVRWKFVHSGGV